MLIDVNEVVLARPLGPGRVEKRIINSDTVIDVESLDDAARDRLCVSPDCVTVALCRSSRSERTFPRFLSDTIEELIARLNPRSGAAPAGAMNEKLEQAMNMMVASVMDTLASKAFDTRLRILEDIAQARQDGDAQLVAEYSAMLASFDQMTLKNMTRDTAPAKSADTRDCTTTCKHAKTPPEQMPCRACADHSHFEARDPPAAKIWRCKKCSAEVMTAGEPPQMLCPECGATPDHWWCCSTAPVTVAELAKLLPADCVRTAEEVHQIHEQTKQARLPVPPKP
jgi:hypothetical protein